MACTCTEEFETVGNTIIGRNKVECQECQTAREAREAQKAKDDEIQEKKNYLASTDYQVIRQSEQSTMSSEDYATLLAARQTARTRINELEA
jgi:hypothetical protein